jgi:hypothetical protein
MLSKLFKCLNGNSELNDTEVSDEFCKRHRAGVYFGFLPLLLFFLFIWLATQEILPQWVCFGLGLMSHVVVFFYVMIYYRCPRCGSTPVSSQFGTTGVLLFPKKCSKCKAPLLPDHKLGQE